jgi:hypothetical protein
MYFSQAIRSIKERWQVFRTPTTTVVTMNLNKPSNSSAEESVEIVRALARTKGLPWRNKSAEEQRAEVQKWLERNRKSA